MIQSNLSLLLLDFLVMFKSLLPLNEWVYEFILVGCQTDKLLKGVSHYLMVIRSKIWKGWYKFLIGCVSMLSHLSFQKGAQITMCPPPLPLPRDLGIHENPIDIINNALCLIRSSNTCVLSANVRNQLTVVDWNSSPMS